jgi:hypothetical protein
MKWSILLTVCLCWTLSAASIQVSVCHPETLEVYPEIDIMVGMKVAIVVSSDQTGIWSGSLFVEDQYRSLGLLSGRMGDPNSAAWSGSCLPAAGSGAVAVAWKDSVRWGFDLYTDDLDRQAGKWFVVDYEAVKPGHCPVAFYDHGYSWEVPDPNESIVFFNSQTRDLYPDGVVNYADFAFFAAQWGHSSGPADPNDPNTLNPADFNLDGSVDLADLCMFSDYWMYGVPGWRPNAKKQPAPLPDPNVTFSIHSADMLSEITLTVGESVTLYIDKASTGDTVYMIDLEAMISDPNLGWIDNTPIDPNNPPGPGTARLLFEPRMTFFDYWGPGQTQDAGIEFVGLDFFAPIQDGALASFVYTATQEGTVELQLCDYINYSFLERMTIHQVSPLQAAAAAPDAGDSITTSSAGSTTDDVNPTELANFLVNLYETETELQKTIDEESWNQFVDSVRDSD